MLESIGLSETLGSLSRILLTEDATLQAGPRRVAEAGCSLLDRCTAASVTIIERERPSTMAATNEIALTLDDAQYQAGDGPCLTAAREGRTIRIDQIPADGRWPAFSHAADRAGFGCSLLVPSRLGGPSTPEA